jgi:hypothetical protein
MAAYQGQIAAYNAQIAQTTASQRSAEAQNAAVITGERTKQEMGKFVAGEGAAGVDVAGPGSAQDVKRSIQSTGMYNAMYVRSKGMQEAYAAQVAGWQDTAQAQLDQYQSQVYSSLAPLSLLGGGLSAAGKLLSPV